MIPLDGLNDAQRQAVVATDSHVLVIAGPGTGKTLTIVRRIGYLIDKGVPPESILALTFSNRAALEMRERVQAFVGRESLCRIFAGTFHLFGLFLLRQSLAETKRVCPRDKQIDLIKSITGKGPKSARQLAAGISRIKNGLDLPDEGEVGQTYRLYQKALSEHGYWDFDDLIAIPTRLVREGRADGQCLSYSHIVVDEYQDVSPGQYELFRALSRASDASVWAVGDADQAIYAFRGADLSVFQKYGQGFAPSRLVVLKENYRSTHTVVRASDALISRNTERFEKELVSMGDQGRPVTLVSVPDEKAQAQFIVREIEARMGGTSHFRMMSQADSRDYSEGNAAFSDFSVLFRTNAQARIVAEALESWGIPGQSVGSGPSGTEQLIEALRSREEDVDDKTDVQALIGLLSDEYRISQTDRLLLEAIAAIHIHEAPRATVLALIDELALLSTSDRYDTRADAVSLMTMHAAKGLEFKTVFIAGCSAGLLPYEMTGNPPDIEEERRLFYVAMTRAKEDIFILSPRRYSLFGRTVDRGESSFLSEIPEGLTRRVTVPDPVKKPPKARQQGLF